MPFARRMHEEVPAGRLLQLDHMVWPWRAPVWCLGLLSVIGRAAGACA
jgi:hypothetical protein